MRKIPATMCTQHPDHASVPYWIGNGDAFVSTKEEVAECFSAFHDLGAEEFMWDWEGKYVDEAVVEKLFSNNLNFFKKNQLGRDIFLTYRIPNIWAEPEYSLSRAFMTILSFSKMAHDMGFPGPPVFEVILPMTDSAAKMMHIKKVFGEFSRTVGKLFGYKHTLKDLSIMPLIENIDDLMRPERILRQYFVLHKKYYGWSPDYLRFHIARSDPALNAGLVPAVLAAKAAISASYTFAAKEKIKIYPAIGVGCLPFRGACNPHNAAEFVREYAGVRTAYIQSAFRYDYFLDEAKGAIKFFNRELVLHEPAIFNNEERTMMEAIAAEFSRGYRRTVERLAPFIDKTARMVPRRRERRQHVGLFGYSRAIGKKRLPRAIPFCAVLYSLGVPPEFIGTGRALRRLKKQEVEFLKKTYFNFWRDIYYAGRFLNKENLRELGKINSAWNAVAEDVKILEEFFGQELGPWSNADMVYRNLAGNALLLLKDKKDISELIVEMGKYRKSLG